MTHKRISKHTLTILIVAMVLVVLAVFRCSYLIQRTLTLEVQKNLKDVATQNAVAVTQEITDKFHLLNSLSNGITDTSTDREKFIPSLKACADIYEFKRMGIVDKDGVTTTTDGYTQDLSYRDFYQDGMKGISSITNSLTDSIGDVHESINVFSVPIYNAEGDVDGVLYATYRTQKFNELVSIQSFDNLGISCIINQDADFIALSDTAPADMHDATNLMNYLRQNNTNYEDSIATLQEYMNSKTQYIGSYQDQDILYYYCMIPLNNLRSDRQWYLLTIVPEQVLWNLANPINAYVTRLILIVFLISACSIILFLYFYHTQKKELLELAYTDPLTGGYNFAAFQQKIHRHNYGHAFYVALDMQNFKIINSSCGVAKGDEALCEIWKVLQSNLRSDEPCTRISADRFFFLMNEQDKLNVERRLYKLNTDLEAISARLNIPRLFPLMGVYETSNHKEPEQIYGKAAQAKHLIKGMRTRHYAFYDELDVAQISENHKIEDDFETGIQNREFQVWYQPKVDPYTGNLLGAEALIRWIKPDGSMLPPNKFIPLFEKNGNIAALDEYVFRAVCEQQQKWQNAGMPLYPISVNISRISLYFGNIVQKYKDIIDSYHLDAKYLPLEITESATVNNSEISSLIDQFHNAGFTLLLDDFGSGYSSLSSLNVMHFDTIKLDKSLIDYIGDSNGEKLLHSITHLAQSLGMSITAEGVETAKQVEFLKVEHCTDIQGYYFSKPLPVEQFVQFMKEHGEAH